MKMVGGSPNPPADEETGKVSHNQVSPLMMSSTSGRETQQRLEEELDVTEDGKKYIINCVKVKRQQLNADE